MQQAAMHRLEEEAVNKLIENKNKKINRYFTLCLELQAIANKNKNNIFAEYPYILAKKTMSGEEQLTILRPGKYIYNFNTKQQALEFKAKIENLLNTLNKKNVEEKQKELYLKIKVIDGGGQVKLRTTAAYNTTKITAQKLLDTTKATIKELQIDILDLKNLLETTENAKTQAACQYELEKAREKLQDQERLLKVLENLNPDTILSKSVEGATLWRLNFWDNVAERRKQIAFGDIVIFYGCVDMGKNYTTVIGAGKQKKRTDTRQADPNLIYQAELEGLKNMYIRKIL